MVFFVEMTIILQRGLQHRLHIFSILRCTIAHDYYHNMALRYITLQHITAVNTHHFDWDTLNGFLITLAVY